ncbi:TIGR03915 family putative DNA repair protein [Pelosinus sp. sgz500959]|uniref:TIGR03915 family putative DNA repair protein n=1 Tax=Pelosinus sp. sgz500959 TaxID=3242472 RepID=UPI0036706F5B
MFNQSNVIYRYDGSFDGLLCCVFESYDKKEIPMEILPPDTSQTVLFDVKEITTDLQKSKRVLVSIPKKIGDPALELVRHAFLTCFTQKELYILLFLRMGYQYGPSVVSMLADDVVNTLFKAVKQLENESHLLKGFVRFSIFNKVLVAEIEPKNYVLPLLTQHFCERYPEERFLIYDKTHGMALIYQPYQSTVIPIDSLEMPEPDEEEESFRKLWQLFYATIEVQGRHNPVCRMSHMPKRYWKYMTEFGYPQKKSLLRLERG